jgi:branched-chain amino acid aminotransferase
MDWCFCLYEAPIPIGIAITLSPFRGPTAECVCAKAAGLYPNNSHALIKAAHHAPNTE